MNKIEPSRKSTGRPLAVILLFLSAILVLAGCSTAKQTPRAILEQPVIEAVFTDVAPKVDGKNDAIWSEAPVTRIKLKKSTETIDVKCLYTKTRIFIQAMYADATHDYIDRPWVFDGTKWKQKGQQDSLVFIWNMNDSIRGFNEHGFSILTQGLEENRHPWEIFIDGGDSRTAPAWFRSQKGDFWSTGLQLPYGKAEDWVLQTDESRWTNGYWHLKLLNQHDQYPSVAPWVLNKNPEWSEPTRVLKLGVKLENDPFPVEADLVDIAGHSPSPGEMQPFIVYRSRLARWGGSKDDIDGAEQWTAGRWTVEMGRLLDTGHPDDIEFDSKSGRVYTFGLLVRRLGSRYEPTDPVKLIFK